jgi:hypothetical protein
MSDERIDVTELEKRFEDGLNWDDSDTMDLITELKRCYNAIDDLTWRHMQVLRERKDLRDSGLSMAKKADFQGNRIESLIDALRIIRDDLDEAIAQGHLPIKSTDGIDATKIRNFANDASQ